MNYLARGNLPKGGEFTRAHNVIVNNMGADKAAEIVKRDWIDLLRQPNLGRKSVGAAIAILDGAGLVVAEECVSPIHTDIWREVRRARDAIAAMRPVDGPVPATSVDSRLVPPSSAAKGGENA